ncbi:MAG: biopolymer transporter ExbD [Sphingobacteriales bacterium]|nr:MAG: biopolymer transporter ExbD [Sphingobacteriales bacterium]
MPRHKIKRSSPSLDMTPMVDLAFLLVTFFMLTTQFRPQEAVAVDTPSSTANIPKPDINVVQLTVAKDGRVFFDMDNNNDSRIKLIKKMSAKYNVAFSDDEINTFGNLAGFGMPIKNLPAFIKMKPSERSGYQQPGIPMDSTQNELEDWVVNARLSNPAVRLAIKGDRDADLTVIRKVMAMVQDKAKVNRFNLLTNMEMAPLDAPKKKQ